MCQQEGSEKNTLLLEKLSFVLFADSDWKLLANPAEKLQPNLSKLLLRVPRNSGVELFSERFWYFLTTLLVNDLFSKALSTCLKKLFWKFRFFKIFFAFSSRFQIWSKIFLDFCRKNCALIVKTSLQVLGRSFWRKKFDFFLFLFRIERKDFRLLS